MLGYQPLNAGPPPRDAAKDASIAALRTANPKANYDAAHASMVASGADGFDGSNRAEEIDYIRMYWNG